MFLMIVVPSFCKIRRFVSFVFLGGDIMRRERENRGYLLKLRSVID